MAKVLYLQWGQKSKGDEAEELFHKAHTEDIKSVPREYYEEIIEVPDSMENEEIWKLLQNGIPNPDSTPTDLRKRVDNLKVRSMSVGDVIERDDVAEMAVSIGFNKIEFE